MMTVNVRKNPSSKLSREKNHKKHTYFENNTQQKNGKQKLKNKKYIITAKKVT